MVVIPNLVDINIVQRSNSIRPLNFGSYVNQDTGSMLSSLQEKLPHLPPEKIRELGAIVRKILETGLAEIIVLYGSHARGDHDQKVHRVSDMPTIKRSDYDILVVVDQPDEEKVIDEYYLDFAMPEYIGASEIKIRQAVDELRKLDTSVDVIVEQIERINALLKTRQYFYLDIRRDGIELYNSGKHQLADFPELDEVTPKVRRQYAEAHFERWFKDAEEFLEVAEFTISKKLYRKAAFNLQQVTEFCYKCVILVYSHYVGQEHNLFKLRRQIDRYEPRLRTIFPIDTPRERELFSKLGRAYIGGRYIHEFEVFPEELEYWSAEIEKLLPLTKSVCEEKIEQLRELEAHR